MDDIQREIELILERKGVPPPGMTGDQFFEEFNKRFLGAFPQILEKAATQIGRGIIIEEMKRIGRSEPCRYHEEKSEKHCTKPPNCHDCPNYRPSPRWQRWLLRLIRRPEFFEPLLVGVVAVSFAAAIFAEEIRVFTLGFWFVIVLISRLHICYLYRQVRKLMTSQ